MTKQNHVNTAAISFAASEIEGSINKRFRLVARSVPDQVAVDVLTDRLTYAQLDDLSDRVAQAISMRPGLTKDVPVALVIDQGHLAMAAILGILKSGRIAVAFPPDSPLEQLRYLWNDTLNPLVLTSQQSLELTRGVVSSENDWLVIEDLVSMDMKDGGRPAIPEPQPEDLALISYTSGSTGNPKGVLHSHRLILQSAFQNQASYQLTPQDRSAVLASFGYGAAKTQCFATLLSGATLYMPELKHLNISTLVEWLHREQITILAMPPHGMFRQMMDGMVGGERLPCVRLVLLGGDDLYKQDVDRFWALFNPEASLVFRLAGSETNLIRELHLHPGMEFSTDKIPVGYPVPDKEILLLDEDGHEVLPGEVGEIVVRSPYLASGYWRQPALTEERFKPDPDGSGGRIYMTGDLARINPAGQMEHLGRKDHMVKIHGFSVHLETIDQALQKLAFVQEAVSVADPLPGGDKRLIAYLVPKNDQKPSVSKIRKELGQHLPEHMLPSAFVWIQEALPRTPTGKLDRKALPPPPRTRPDIRTPLVLPRNDFEERLTQVWMGLLQLEQVGVEDNFFELGGNSLLSIQMIVAVEKLSDQKVPTAYFQQPTIAHLAEILQEAKQTGKQQPLYDRGGVRQNGSRTPAKRVSRYRSALGRFVKGRMSPLSVLQRIHQFLSNSVLSGYKLIYKGAVLPQPYPQGREWIIRWAHIPLVAQGLYREQYHLFRRMVAELNGCTLDPATAFATSLAGNLIRRLGSKEYSEDGTNTMIDRLRASSHLFWLSLSDLIENAPLDELDRYFSVTNLEYLKQAYEAGRGVIILTYHSTFNRLAMAALPRRFQGEQIPTISEKSARRQSPHWLNNQGRDLPGTDRAALNAGVALQGLHLLEQGKMVQLVSDNEYEQKDYPMVLAGRRYHLKPGFAELAYNSGARVVPQFTTMQPDGNIHTRFFPPLIIANGSRETQIKSLMEQYVVFINTSWRLAPESLSWDRINRHFYQPLA